MTDRLSNSIDGHRSELFVVRVRDDQNTALAGHDGGEYESPPQERERALALVARLLAAPVAVNGEAERQWQLPIAGGQRSVTLQRAAR